MMLKVIPPARKREALEAMLLQIGLHRRSVDSVGPTGIERALNLCGLRIRPGGGAGLACPILHHHGDAGRSTAVCRLPDKGYIKPQVGIAGLRPRTRGKKDSQQPYPATQF